MMNWTATVPGAAPVVVTSPDQARLLDQLQAEFDAGRGFSVATLNLDHVVKLRSDAAFRAAYAAHSHITADGNPIVWLCHMAGQGEVALTPGSELIVPLSRLAVRAGVRVAFFGSTQDTLEAAAAGLREQAPGIDIALIRAPGMGFDPEGPEAQSMIEAIGASGVRLVFLALGAPRQECFAAFAQTRLADVGFVSIGAGLDFIAGRQRRAPRLVQRLAAEWLWRLMGAPRRLGLRYLRCLLILPGLAWEAFFRQGR